LFVVPKKKCLVKCLQRSNILKIAATKQYFAFTFSKLVHDLKKVFNCMDFVFGFADALKMCDNNTKEH